MAALQAAGLSIPILISAMLLIDTGASCSSIDATLIAQLGLQATGSTQILTPSTGAVPHICSTYDVGLMIPGAVPAKTFPALPVVEGHYLAQGHHGLLGRDALAEARVVYSGPNNFVMISF